MGSESAPPLLLYGSRASWALSLALLGLWVQRYLGGLGLAPAAAADGGNDTSALFNWHPVCMVLAFGVCMTESLLAFRGHALGGAFARLGGAKGLHLALHSVAILAVLFGLVTVVQSHTLKRPTPMNDMYSSHSYLGALAAFLFLLQYAAAFAVYWLEGFKAYRKPLLAAHRALGFVVWSLGIATCMSGVTEKATFVYAYGTANFKVVTLLDHYSPALFLPGLLQLALAGLWTCTAVHLLFPFFEEGPRKAGGLDAGEARPLLA